MGVCTFFDKSMKVLSSILAMATAQWDGFNYDDYSDVGKNQISQVSVQDIAQLNGLSAGTQLNNYNLPNHYLGNGLKCFYCNERSVGDCFTKSTFSVCQGQEYFCFFHERRKISHFFNRREKYIDNIRSTNGDAFLGRRLNEAFNAPSALGGSASDRDAPSTQIHVMAGCQQPQACLRQQAQNNAINIGVAFYGSSANTVGSGNFPTSRRNVREGLCRLGKDWSYYSGHKWEYENVADDLLGSIPRSTQLTAERDDGHQFYHERESWYNGMRPNGFKQEFHGGKGTESVCHFCCNPATTDGNFCNRRLLDGSATTTSSDGVFTFSDTTGSWYDAAGSTAVNAAIRADDDTHTYAG